MPNENKWKKFAGKRCEERNPHATNLNGYSNVLTRFWRCTAQTTTIITAAAAARMINFEEREERKNVELCAVSVAAFDCAKSYYYDL